MYQGTWDEWGRPWGRQRDVTQADLQDDWEKWLGVTAARVGDLTAGDSGESTDVLERVLNDIITRIQPEPFNSEISRFAQGLAVQLCIALRRRLGEQWNFEANKILECWGLGASHADGVLAAGVSAAAAASGAGVGVSAASGTPAACGVGVSQVPPPAPGYHDAKAFPELDSQRVPLDLCSALADDEPPPDWGSASGEEGVVVHDSDSEGIAARDEPPRDESPEAAAISLEDIGWNKALSKFTRIDRQGFEDVAPMIMAAETNRRKLAMDAAVLRMKQRGATISQHDALAHIRQMRLIFDGLKRRRAELLVRYRDIKITGEIVESFMKEHRNAFNNSEGQRRFCALDKGSCSKCSKRL